MTTVLALLLLVSPGFDEIDFSGGTEERLRLLKHKNPGVRLRAAQLLEHAPPQRALAAMLVALGDVDAHVRGAAARTLGSWGDERATPFLARAIKIEEVPAILRDMLLALSRCGGRYAGRLVLPFLEHPSLKVRAAAAAALGRLGDAGQRKALWAAFRFDSDDHGSALRAAVLGAFTQLGWDEDVRKAVGELEAGDALRAWRVRVAVVLAIGGVRWKERAAWLKALVERDKDARVLAAAASALVQIGERDHVARWLKHQNALVRRAALDALSGVGDPRAAAAAATFVRQDPDVALRFRAALILHETRHVDADLYMVDAMRSDDASIWISALAALERRYGKKYGRNPGRWTEFLKQKSE